jgi:hypothetical protein
MDSYEVVREALEQESPKAVAQAMGVSLSLVYKWAQPPEQGGAVNPLDRADQLRTATGDARIVEWLCQRADGYFVRNPESMCERGYEVLPATQGLVQKFASLLASISQAASDNHICDNEAAQIRGVWDELKAHAEGFVRCCEEGDYAKLVEPKAV